MIYRSKAPLRIGLAGGGTDVSPYSDLYGGAVLNATISHYAHATIEPLAEKVIILEALDQRQSHTFACGEELPIDGTLDLLKGVYNRMRKEYTLPEGGFKLSTFVDAPAGSGLGTSSTLVVAIIGVFAEMLRIPLSEYDIAHLAYNIERSDLKMAGGKQDQYGATFGGVNFMEFYEGDRVVVNPLRVKTHHLFELEHNLLLFYTSTSRNSSTIIERQCKNVHTNNVDSIEAMHQLKNQAHMLKEALLKGRLHEIGDILDYGFEQKRKMAEGISNPTMEHIYEIAKNAGATGGKISGAGGGGFMIFYCPGTTKHAVEEALTHVGGHFKPYRFVEHGLTTWTV